MRRPLTLATLLLVSVPLTACSFSNSMRYKSETDLTLTAEHVRGTALLVDTRNGRVEVVADPQRSDVLIEARLRCRGRTQQEADQRLAATTVSVSRDADQRLVVKPVFPDGPRNGDGASVSIRIPDVNGAHFDTSNGSVVAKALSGLLVADTSNGGVTVTDHDGDVRLDTSNGGVSVTNLTGRLWADTSNGAITLKNVGGPVEADTSNGAIRLTMAHDHSGPLRLDTSNGSITVQVGSAFNGSVTFETSNGSIHVNDHAGRISSSSLSRSHGRITVGEGGQPSRLDTSNGSIRFTIEG